MEIYVMHNDERLGPFSPQPQDAQAQIDSGNFSTTDYAWTAGLNDWKPLSEILLHFLPAPENTLPVKASPVVHWLSRSRFIMASALSLLLIGGVAAFMLTVSQKKRAVAALSKVTPSEESSANMDLRALMKKARHSVLLIEVYDDGGKAVATGSGFFVSDDGLLVTNYHVIENASRAVAKADNGELFPIKGALQFDRENDLVLLAVEGRKLPFLVLGNTEKVEAGDHVAIIGSPLGLEGTLSEGIVSAKRGETSGEHEWLQITAPISPGSSGSPVLDSSGKVIGIATLVLRGGQSLNFAVPVELAFEMLQVQNKERAVAPVSLQKLADLNRAADSTAKEKTAAEYAIAERAVLDSPEYQAASSATSDARNAAGVNSIREKLQADAVVSPAVAAERSQILTKTPRRAVDWKRALDATTALVAKYPRSAIAYKQLGNIHEMMGFSDQAIEAYQRAVELNPDFSSVWESLGGIYKEKGKSTQADFAFSQAIAYQTKWVQSRRAGEYGFSLSILGNMQREAGNIDAAKQTYLRDVRENPELAIMSLTALIDIYLAEDNEKGAFEIAYQIMLLNVNHQNPEAEAWDFLAGCYYQRNRNEDGYRCEVNARDLGLRR